jgi:hypothetical protein
MYTINSWRSSVRRGSAYMRRRGTRRHHGPLSSRQESAPHKYGLTVSHSIDLTQGTGGAVGAQKAGVVINIPDGSGSLSPGIPLVSRALSSVPGELSVLPLPPRQLMRAEGLQGPGGQQQPLLHISASEAGAQPPVRASALGAPMTSGSPAAAGGQQPGPGVQAAGQGSGADVGVPSMSDMKGTLAATTATGTVAAVTRDPHGPALAQMRRASYLPSALHPAPGQLPTIHSPSTQSLASIRSPFASQAQLSLPEEAADSPRPQPTQLQQSAVLQEHLQATSRLTRPASSNSSSCSSLCSQKPTTPRASRQNSATPLMDPALPMSTSSPPHTSALATTAASTVPGAGTGLSAGQEEQQPLLLAPTSSHNTAQLHTSGMRGPATHGAAPGVLSPPGAVPVVVQAGGGHSLSGSGVQPGVLAARLESLLSSALVEPVTFPDTEEGFIAQVCGPTVVVVVKMTAGTHDVCLPLPCVPLRCDGTAFNGCFPSLLR